MEIKFTHFEALPDVDGVLRFTQPDGRFAVLRIESVGVIERMGSVVEVVLCSGLIVRFEAVGSDPTALASRFVVRMRREVAGLPPGPDEGSLT